MYDVRTRIFTGCEPMEFYDRSQKLRYLYARETARRLVEQPALVERGRRYLEKHIAPDPQMRRYYALWDRVLRYPAAEIAKRLTANDPEGQQLRDSMPVFEPIEGKVRDQIIQASKSGR